MSELKGPSGPFGNNPYRDRIDTPDDESAETLEARRTELKRLIKSTVEEMRKITVGHVELRDQWMDTFAFYTEYLKKPEHPKYSRDTLKTGVNKVQRFLEGARIVNACSPENMDKVQAEVQSQGQEMNQRHLQETARNVRIAKGLHKVFEIIRQRLDAEVDPKKYTPLTEAEFDFYNQQLESAKQLDSMSNKELIHYAEQLQLLDSQHIFERIGAHLRQAHADVQKSYKDQTHPHLVKEIDDVAWEQMKHPLASIKTFTNTWRRTLNATTEQYMDGKCTLEQALTTLKETIERATAAIPQGELEALERHLKTSPENQGARMSDYSQALLEHAQTRLKETRLQKKEAHVYQSFPSNHFFGKRLFEAEYEHAKELSGLYLAPEVRRLRRIEYYLRHTKGDRDAAVLATAQTEISEEKIDTRAEEPGIDAEQEATASTVVDICLANLFKSSHEIGYPIDPDYFTAKLPRDLNNRARLAQSYFTGDAVNVAKGLNLRQQSLLGIDKLYPAGVWRHILDLKQMDEHGMDGTQIDSYIEIATGLKLNEEERKRLRDFLDKFRNKDFLKFDRHVKYKLQREDLDALFSLPRTSRDLLGCCWQSQSAPHSRATPNFAKIPFTMKQREIPEAPFRSPYRGEGYEGEIQSTKEIDPAIDTLLKKASLDEPTIQDNPILKSEYVRMLKVLKPTLSDRLGSVLKRAESPSDELRIDHVREMREFLKLVQYVKLCSPEGRKQAQEKLNTKYTELRDKQNQETIKNIKKAETAGGILANLWRESKYGGKEESKQLPPNNLLTESEMYVISEALVDKETLSKMNLDQIHDYALEIWRINELFPFSKIADTISDQERREFVTISLEEENRREEIHRTKTAQSDTTAVTLDVNDQPSETSEAQWLKTQLPDATSQKKYQLWKKLLPMSGQASFENLQNGFATLTLADKIEVEFEIAEKKHIEELQQLWKSDEVLALETYRRLNEQRVVYGHLYKGDEKTFTYSVAKALKEEKEKPRSLPEDEVNEYGTEAKAWTINRFRIALAMKECPWEIRTLHNASLNDHEVAYNNTLQRLEDYAEEVGAKTLLADLITIPSKTWEVYFRAEPTPEGQLAFTVDQRILLNSLIKNLPDSRKGDVTMTLFKLAGSPVFSRIESDLRTASKNGFVAEEDINLLESLSRNNPEVAEYYAENLAKAPFTTKKRENIFKYLY